MKDKAKDEILEAINSFSTAVDERFSGIEKHNSSIESIMVTRQDLNTLKLDMLDAMDDKLVNLKGDLTIMMRREDKKVSELISILKEKEVLSQEEVERLMVLDPFPQSV